ncbi:hypothetical protein H9Q72_000225 [Fusarium xylarioides]|uniref:Helicase C-terminal domain-containing protein n=1 Tax=Fusarium xylarioides TaxID=221167 RepID=A0A9P7LFM8_9HYPO|nr:hypothetical protein H9Q72_000225 [Fusarium xylarioides]
MASSASRRLIKKEQDDSDDECTFLSSNKKGDSKQTICIDDDDDDDDDDESISGLFTQPREVSDNDNLNIVKEESDDEKENFKTKGLKPPSKDTITVGDFCDTIDIDPDSSDEDTDDEDDLDSSHEKDSDYHDSDDSDDSDESDDSETQQNKHKPKRGVHKVSDFRKLIKKCENEKNALLVRQYMGEKLSPAECEKLEKLKKQIPKAQKALEKYAREEHIYCRDCLSIATSGVTKMGRPRVPPQCRIPACSPKLGMGQAVKTLKCIDAAVKAMKRYKEPGRDSIGTRWTGGPKDMASFFRAVCGRDDIDYGPVRMPLSSKVKATLAVMLAWMEEAPDDKIIIYVQWTRTAKALGCVLESLGMKFLYYNRMANQKQKTRALDEFTNNTDVKILVSSMKCGGQSLNLQMANRVIIVDEWWNKAAEEQAFKRVYRTGQLKETHLVRIIAKDSIDEPIIMLQDAKEEIIQAALQDGEMQPNFSNYLQLQMLFSGKDKETLIAEMEQETRAKQAKQ